jgi:tripartite-type tricarboxylate transporter receptor subunit TctC
MTLRNLNRFYLGCWLLVAFTLALPSPAPGQTPGRTITIVVPFTPGTGPDILARTIGEEIQRRWNQPVVVDNKPGASGNIGTQIVARAAPDGHTLLMATSSTHVILPLVQGRAALGYDAIADFTPISIIGTVPNILIASPSLPVTNVAELVAYAKAHPGELFFSSSGTGTITHLIGELFKARTGIDVQHVPYRGGNQSAVDLMQGRVGFLFDNIVWSLPLIREGRLRGLGITTQERSRLAPDMPTIAESGLPGFEAVTWVGLVGPARMPDAAVQRIAAELATLRNDPALARRFADFGSEGVFSRPEEMRALIAAETESWGNLISQAGVRIQ